jgi:NAD(P)-dependent dehydrogenase (short-subunit alcohol dehydrogenase family)
MRLQDKVAVVTGAGSGIGQAIALRFAAEGADVVIPDIKLAAAEETAERVRALGRRALAMQVDVSRSADVKRAITTTVEQLGRIDIMVNNAGIRFIAPLTEVSDEDWNRVIAINLTGVFYGIREVVPQMKKQGGGKIINMASITGVSPMVDRIAYCTAKGGVITMTKEAALELAGTGICVNAIAPGFVLTPLTAFYEHDPRMAAVVKSSSPHGRWGQTTDIASAALYLASSEADWVNGTTLFVDGGYTAGKLF